MCVDVPCSSGAPGCTEKECEESFPDSDCGSASSSSGPGHSYDEEEYECGCELYYECASKCGCASWGSWSGWRDGSSGCSASGCDDCENDHRTVYY